MAEAGKRVKRAKDGERVVSTAVKGRQGEDPEGQTKRRTVGRTDPTHGRRDSGPDCHPHAMSFVPRAETAALYMLPLLLYAFIRYCISLCRHGARGVRLPRDAAGSAMHPALHLRDLSTSEPRDLQISPNVQRAAMVTSTTLYTLDLLKCQIIHRIDMDVGVEPLRVAWMDDSELIVFLSSGFVFTMLLCDVSTTRICGDRWRSSSLP